MTRKTHLSFGSPLDILVRTRDRYGNKRYLPTRVLVSDQHSLASSERLSTGVLLHSLKKETAKCRLKKRFAPRATIAEMSTLKKDILEKEKGREEVKGIDWCPDSG